MGRPTHGARLVSWVWLCMRPILGMLLLSSFVVPELAAQVREDSICVAASDAWRGAGNRLWPDDAWQGGQDTLPRSVEWVTNRLSGTYRLLEIASEGYGSVKWVREWNLALARPDPDSAALWGTRMGQKVYEVPVAGTKTLLREGPLDSATFEVVRATYRTEESARINYRGRDRLVLQSGPYNTVDGDYALYSISEVDEHGNFAGRWTEGGYGIPMHSTGVGALGEPPQGYFCAFRR